MNEEELIELVFKPKKKSRKLPGCPVCGAVKIVYRKDKNGHSFPTYSCGYSRSVKGVVTSCNSLEGF